MKEFIKEIEENEKFKLYPFKFWEFYDDKFEGKVWCDNGDVNLNVEVVHEDGLYYINWTIEGFEYPSKLLKRISNNWGRTKRFDFFSKQTITLEEAIETLYIFNKEIYEY